MTGWKGQLSVRHSACGPGQTPEVVVTTNETAVGDIIRCPGKLCARQRGREERSRLMEANNMKRSRQETKSLFVNRLLTIAGSFFVMAACVLSIAAGPAFASPN